MSNRILKFIKLHRKSILPVIAGLFAVGSCIFVFSSVQKTKTEFSPDNLLASNVDFLNNMFEKNAFDGTATGENGEELNNQSQDQKSLEDGNEELLKDKKNGENDPLTLSKGNENAPNKNGNGATVTDGLGDYHVVAGAAAGMGIGADGAGTTAAGAAGSDDINRAGSTQSTADASQNGGQALPGEKPIPVPDEKDEAESAPYGGNTAAEVVSDSMISNEAYVGVRRLALFSSVPDEDNMFFYPGEFPSAAVMKKSLSVNARLTATVGASATTTDIGDLNYCYKNDKTTYGGDYCIDWDSTTPEIENAASTVAGVHQAQVYLYNPTTGSNVNALSSFCYHTIDFKLALADVEASEEAQILRPVGESISLVEAQKNLNKKLLARTMLEESMPGSYSHTFSKNPDGSYLNNFKGWSETEAGKVLGSCYWLQHPDKTDVTPVVENGQQVYCWEKSLYPIWQQEAAQNTVFTTTLREDGSFVVTGYNPADAAGVAALTIPEGTMVLDLSAMSAKTFSNLRTITIPADTTEIILPQDMSAYSALQEFHVSPDNQSYLDIAGILYDKTGKTLLKVPAATHTITVWSKYVNTVSSYAFANTTFDELALPAGVYKLESNAFAGSSIQTLSLKTAKVPELGTNAFGLQTLSSGDTLAISKLLVPDSEGDSVYLNDLSLLIDTLEADGSSTAEELAIGMLATETGPQNAYSYLNGWILRNGGAEIVRATAKVGSIAAIPDGVTTIPAGFLQTNAQITELTIPGSVTGLADGCFESAAVQKIIFDSENVPGLSGSGKLFGAEMPQQSKLYVRDIYYDNYQSIWSRMERRGYGAGSTEKMMMPYGDSVQTDSAGAKYWTHNGATILLDGTAVTAGEYTLPAEVTQVRVYAFQGNTAITRLTINSNAPVSINERAFMDNSSLACVEVSGAGISAIGKEAFRNCTSLSRFVWGSLDTTNNLNSIGNLAFSYTALTGLSDAAVNLGLNIAEADLGQFDSCVIFEGYCQMRRTTYFKNLSSIEDFAFGYSPNIKQMSIPKFGDETEWTKLVATKFKLNWFLHPDAGTPETQPIGSAKTAIDNYVPGSGGDEGVI